MREFEHDEIFTPLGMANSALGLGRLDLQSTVRAGVGGTAATNSAEEEEYGGNSPYWRDQGHPWGVRPHVPCCRSLLHLDHLTG